MRTALSPTLAKLMAGARQLTRSGQLMEATAAIQRALGGSAPMAPPRHGSDAGPIPGVAARAGAFVLDGLVSELPVHAPSSPQSVTEVSAGFTVHTYADATGPRTYKLYTPSAARAGRPLPMVVMLHGCTQDPDDFAAGTRMNPLAEREGWFVLYPAQAPRSNVSKCWNWFNPADQRHGRGEPALLAAMTREVLARCPVDPDRVYVAGLSAGGAMAAILGREYPELYAAVGVHSGLPPGAASDVASAFAAMKSGDRPRRAESGARAVPTIVFHGDDDPTVHPEHGRHVIDDALALAARGTPDAVLRDAGGPGRRATRSVYRDAEGRSRAEHWEVHGSGHAWSGGSSAGSYTDPGGPDASAEMLRFFAQQPRRSAAAQA